MVAGAGDAANESDDGGDSSDGDAAPIRRVNRNTLKWIEDNFAPGAKPKGPDNVGEEKGREMVAKEAEEQPGAGRGVHVPRFGEFNHNLNAETDYKVSTCVLRALKRHKPRSRSDQSFWHPETLTISHFCHLPMCL